MTLRIILGGLMILFGVQVVHSLDRVRLATFPSQGKNAGLIWALQSGLFEANGLEVEIIDTRQNTISLLESGQADIAQVLCSSVGFFTSKGADLKIIAVRDQRNPVATISLQDNPVESVSDFDRKRWGYSASFSPEQFILKKLADQHEVNFENIIKLNVDFPLRVGALINGEVDFISGWIGSALPPFTSAIEKTGAKPVVLYWEDLGVDIYGECFAAKSSALASSGEIFEKFITTAKQAYFEVIGDPSVGMNAVIAFYKGLVIDKEILAEQIEQSNSLLGSGDKDDILSVEEEKLQQTFEWLSVNPGVPVSALIWEFSG